MVDNNDDELFQGLFHLITDIHAVAQKSHHQHGGFRGQGRIIHLLAGQNHPLTQRKLAALAQIQPGSLTQLLEKMERDQLIRRQRSQHDRRSIEVTLTSKGQQQYKQIIAHRVAFEKQMVSDISDEERQQFLRVISKLDQNLLKYHHLQNQPREVKQ